MAGGSVLHVSQTIGTVTVTQPTVDLGPMASGATASTPENVFILTFPDQTTDDAKKRSNDLVGGAMASADQLLRAAAKIAEQTERARAALAKAAEEAERHIVAIPGVAARVSADTAHARRLKERA